MRVLCACAFALVFAASLRAQQTTRHANASADAGADAVQLDRYEVTADKAQLFSLGLSQASSTGSRLGLKTLDIPASVETLSGDLIRFRGDVNLMDAVTRATGIINLGAPGNGGSSLGSRGFSGHGTVMQLYDGTRFYVASGSVTFPTDPWMVDRVEILHGPASVLFGDAATAGSINYVPRKPSRIPGGAVRVAYGSDTTWRAALDSTGPLSSIASYRADISHNRSDTSVDNNDTDNLALAGSVRFDPTPDLAITFSYDYAVQEPSRYYGTPLIDGRIDKSIRDRNFNAGDAIIKYTDRWARMSAGWKPSHALRVANHLYYLTSDRHWKNIEAFTWNAATRLVDRGDPLEIIHAQEQLGDRIDATLDTRILGGDRRNTLLLGADINRIDFKHTNNSPYAGANSSVDPYRPGGIDQGVFTTTSPTTPGFKTRTRQNSLFAEDRLELTRAWSLVAGLRYDHVTLNRKDYRNAASSYRKSYDFFTWRAGTVYKILPTLSAYAQYSTAADPSGGSLITTSAAQKTYDLTTSRQGEIGVKQTFWQSRGEWTFSLYKIQRKNLPITISGVTNQIGQQSSYGAELGASVRLGHGIRLNGNLAWLRAKYDEYIEGGVSRNGKRPASVPDFTANLWADWSIIPVLDLGGGVRYVSGRYGNTANTLTVPDYTVFDFQLRWQALKQLAVTVRLKNAFDKLYATTTGNSGRQWYLGAPRAIECSADIKF